mgnify:CR=1 FL=1
MIADLFRDDTDRVDAKVAEVLELFPRLKDRYTNLAGDMSGGEQQMLTLGMAFLAKPRLLMIDELSLGLSPAVVGQLLEIVRRDGGAIQFHGVKTKSDVPIISGAIDFPDDHPMLEHFKCSSVRRNRG